MFPTVASPSRRSAMTEFLARLNHGLLHGAFEIDLADGEILRKTSLSARDAALTPALIHNLVEDNLDGMDTYFPALLDVIRDRRSPAETVAAVEARPGH